MIGGLTLSSVMVLFFWKTPSPMQWLLLMWLGMLGAVGHFFMIKAFEKAPASLLAPFNCVTYLGDASWLFPVWGSTGCLDHLWGDYNNFKWSNLIKSESSLSTP